IRYFHVTGVQTCALPISFLTGKCRFVATVVAKISGLPAGVEGQIRLYEVDQDNERQKVYPIQEWVASAGNTFVHHCSVGTVENRSEERRVAEDFFRESRT